MGEKRYDENGQEITAEWYDKRLDVTFRSLVPKDFNPFGPWSLEWCECGKLREMMHDKCGHCGRPKPTPPPESEER